MGINKMTKQKGMKMIGEDVTKTELNQTLSTKFWENASQEAIKNTIEHTRGRELDLFDWLDEMDFRIKEAHRMEMEKRRLDLAELLAFKIMFPE